MYANDDAENMSSSTEKTLSGCASLASGVEGVSDHSALRILNPHTPLNRAPSLMPYLKKCLKLELKSVWTICLSTIKFVLPFTTFDLPPKSIIL